MALQVVGAGVGRTGTWSLKEALERLTGGRCYHMIEVFGQPHHVPVWQAAVRGELPEWDDFLQGYAATVDWPASAFWRELSDANPDAVVLLSTRDVDEWWRSASNTIFSAEIEDMRSARSDISPDWPGDLFAARFTPRWRDEASAKAAYLRHNDEVREAVPPDRLLEWHPGDGWEPICTALGVDVPDEPFPHVNTTAAWRAMLGLSPLS
jgi:hypothetical protein